MPEVPRPARPSNPPVYTAAATRPQKPGRALVQFGLQGAAQQRNGKCREWRALAWRCSDQASARRAVLRLDIPAYRLFAWLQAESSNSGNAGQKSKCSIPRHKDCDALAKACLKRAACGRRVPRQHAWRRSQCRARDVGRNAALVQGHRPGMPPAWSLMEPCAAWGLRLARHAPAQVDGTG